MVPARGRLVYESGQWEVDLGQRELRARGIPIPIGGRAFEIIEALVQSAGELVSKDDLMGRVWPDVVVEENTLQVHISAIRKALGPDRGLLRTASGHGYRLLGAWTARSKEMPAAPLNLAPAPVVAPASAGNLPVSNSDLIGRAAAVQHLLDLVSAYRVVTLAGPGGIGKTRLALEVAHGLAPVFRGERWFIELGSLSDPDLVPSAAAGVLGLELGGDLISPTSIARAIGGRQILLILDSCEHVIDAAAELAETIVRMCPRASVLATSRELLRIDGEYTYRVPALDVPATGTDGPQEVIEHSAVQLLIARTRALLSDFSPRPADLPTIGAICRRLDGIPLAIELAAARAATLGLEPVLSRLDERFALLTGGRRTALPRHKTLRATLDWSYELLPEAERRLLRFLSVFAAGFTLEAAAAVMSEAGNSAPAIMEGIANLVAKSLVALDGNGAVSRWRLLETTRAYGLEKLRESGESEQAARRHAEFFRDLVTSASEATPTPENLARYGREIDNVRVALDWAFSPAGDPAIGRVLTAAYVPVWFDLELMVECRERTERALDSVDAAERLSDPLRMQLHIALGVALTFTMGPVERARMVSAKALEIAESLDDVDAQLRTLWCLCALYWDIGETRASHSLAERFTRVARRTGDPAVVLVGERLIGTTLQTGGRQIEARRSFERVLDLYVVPRDRRHTIWFQYDQRVLARAMLARVLWLQGFVDQAREQAQASLAAAQAAGHVSSGFYALVYAVFPISVMTGDFLAAERAVAMLIDLATRHNATYWRNVGRCLEGKLLIMRGEHRAGAILLRAALDTCNGTGWTMSAPEFLGVLAQAQAALGEHGDALAVVDQALTRADDGGERWYFAELLRIRGELLLPGADDRSLSSAEACFARAMDIAREQGALFWELRAALSLARLRIRQDRVEEARQLLAPTYERFSEGFETADLRAARDLL
jgi:predicted ATPase/DNA-binding winged helix-turn-helix (wHTH) protein